MARLPEAGQGADDDAPAGHDLLCNLMGRAVRLLASIRRLLCVSTALLALWFACWLASCIARDMPPP